MSVKRKLLIFLWETGDPGTALGQVVKSVNNWRRDSEQLLYFKFFGQSLSEGQKMRDGKEQSSLSTRNSLWITGTKMDVLMSITEYLSFL